jgi:hypothetical protein
VNALHTHTITPLRDKGVIFYGLARLQSAKFSLIRVAPVTAKERTWGSVRAALGVAIHEMPWMPFAVRWSRINQHPTGGQAFCMQTAKIFSEFCDYKQARELHGSWKMESNRQDPPFPERATSSQSPSPVLKTQLKTSPIFERISCDR